MATRRTNNGNGRRRNFRRYASNIITIVINTATRVLGNPMFLVSVAVSLYLSLNQKLIVSFCNKFAKSTLLEPIFSFIKTHTGQTAGFILAGTASLTTLPPRYSFAAFIILGFVCYLCPEAEYVEYLALTCFTILFIRIRNIRSRILIVLLIVLTIAAGWWGQKLFKMGPASIFTTQTSCESASFSWSSGNKCVEKT